MQFVWTSRLSRNIEREYNRTMLDWRTDSRYDEGDLGSLLLEVG